jgi:Fe-S oxidoreductase
MPRREPILREGSPVSQEVLWSCTTCRACEDICPVNIQHLDLILESRKNQVLMEATFPPEMQETFTNLENQSNPWGFAADTRADWCQGPGCAAHDRPARGGGALFRGVRRCLRRPWQEDRPVHGAGAAAGGVDFAILGPEEGCNGDVARRAGNEYLAQMLIQANVEVLDSYKPKKILAGCPHCFNMLKNEYPGFGASYPVVHHSAYLFELLRQGRLTVNDTASAR